MVVFSEDLQLGMWSTTPVLTSASAAIRFPSLYWDINLVFIRSRSVLVQRVGGPDLCQFQSRECP